MTFPVHNLTHPAWQVQGFEIDMHLNHLILTLFREMFSQNLRALPGLQPKTVLAHVAVFGQSMSQLVYTTTCRTPVQPCVCGLSKSTGRSRHWVAKKIFGFCFVCAARIFKLAWRSHGEAPQEIQSHCKVGGSLLPSDQS